ncbi:MAG: retropepsin-like domain-containing protein [Alphaproteobacteria bacterium]|nr:retropepsin-like domain-containing protein [Alphaproteobacteria bacterium]
MRNGIWLGLCALALGLLTAQGAAAGQCELKLIASYSMMGNPKYEVVVPIVMAGKPVATGIQTGAVVGFISPEVSTALGLLKRRINPNTLVYGADGARYDQYVTMPTIDIGAIEARNTKLVLVDDTLLPHREPWATLGANILQIFDLEFDFAEKKLRFFSQDHCDGQVVYWSAAYTSVPFHLLENGQIALEMTLDGRPIDAILNSGSSYTYINARIAADVYGIDENSSRVTTVKSTYPGAPPIRAAVFDSLSIGGISMPRPTLCLQEDTLRSRAIQDIPIKTEKKSGMDIPHYPNLELGLDVLHHLRVYIAYREHKIYATAADAQ